MAKKGMDQLQLAVELEKSKLNREKSLLLVDKAIILYLSFLFVGVIGFVNKVVSAAILNGVVVLGLLVLTLGIIPYVMTMHKEQIKLDALSLELKGRKR